jgi:two-component system response regulator YesN
MNRATSVTIAKIRKLLTLKQSVIFAWLISYMTVLLIPILISGVIYFKTVRVVEEEIIKSNHFCLKRAEQRMDGLVNDAIRLSQELASNSRLNDLFCAGTTEPVRPYDLYLGVKELKSYTILNNSIEDFYIYSKDLDLVLSSYSSGDSRSFYKAYIQETGLSYQAWYQLATDYHRGDFIPIPYYYAHRSPSKKLLFIQTVSLSYLGGSTVNIVTVLDESKFIEDAQDIEAINQGMVLLVNRANQMIGASQPDASIQGIEAHRFTGDAGMFRATIKGRKVVVSYIISQKTSWKYITVIPTRVFWEKVEYVRNLIGLSLAFCLLIGGLIAFYAVKKNYSPVKKLILLLEKSLDVNYDKRNNEYQFIEQAINKAHTDLEKVDEILIQQNITLRGHFLARLLTGKMAAPDIEARMALYDLHFNSEVFAVMVFYITDFEATPAELDERFAHPDAMADFTQVQTILMKTLEKLFVNQNQGLMIEINDLLVCLVNFAEEQVAQAKQELLRITAVAQASLAAAYQIHFTVSASSLHRTIAGIPAAYDEALQTMEHKKLLGIEDIIFSEEFNDLPKGNYYYPLEKEQQLINCIKIGDVTKAGAILDEIFQKNFEKMILPVKLARCLMFNLISTMIKTITEVSGEADDDFLAKFNQIEALLHCENINEMKQEMQRLLALFCDRINQQKRARKLNKSIHADWQLVEKVKAYIQQNYQDVNLNITSIAGSFKIHPVTLSRIFTEHTDEGLLDYINRLRITKAEELIKAGSQNLEAVAQAVGYYSSRTFARAFKKHVGVTPGKFKETVI